MSQFSDASEAESFYMGSNPIRMSESLSRQTMEVESEATKTFAKTKVTSESSSPRRCCSCCSCCSCLIYPMYHEKKRIRYPARFSFFLLFAYFAYSLYIVSDLLKLLQCEKASCYDWCVRMDTGRIMSLSRVDNHLDFETEAIFRYPARTHVGLGTSELKLNYDGKTMMVMTSSVPSFTHEDGTVSNKLMYGESRMFVNASGELGNLDIGASLFGKIMSEKAIELEIEVKATVTTWAFSFFPITLTMPTRKEAYTCRQVNASTICDVGTLDQFDEISCVNPNEYPIEDPIIHSINFVQSPSPNSLKLWSNFTVDHGSSLDLYADFPDISVAVYTTDSFNPYSEQDRLTDSYTPIAIVTVVGGRMHGKYVTGVVEVDVVGTDERIKELQDVVDIILDDSDEPEVLLYIQGIADTGNNAFLQRILALMPTIKMLDYENVNINTIAKDFNLSDSVQLQSMSLTDIGEDPDSNLETSLHSAMFLNIPFNCYGAVAPVSMDLLDPDDTSDVLLRGVLKQTVLYGQDNPAQADITVSLIDPGRLITLAGDGRITELKLTGTPTSSLLLSQVLSTQELDLEPVIAGMLNGKNASIGLNSFDVNASLTFEESTSSSIPTFHSYFNANISNLPVTFDIEVGALNLTITSLYPPLTTPQPVFSLITADTKCPKDSFCAVKAEMAIMTAPTRDMLTAYTNQDEVKVTGYGTIASTPNISLPLFTFPTFPTLSSVQNLTSLIDSTCETKSGLCLFDGAVNVETLNILGETISGGDIDVPCVFGEGLCPLYTPSQIQQLPPTSAAMGINVTVDVADYVPFLKKFQVDFPEIALGVDMGDKVDSLSLIISPVTITDKLRFTQMIYAAGSVNDWSAIFRALCTFNDQGANITAHGSPSASPSSLSSAIPDITLQIPKDSNDFDFQLPDLPLPYKEVNNSAPQWILTETTSTSAKFQIEVSFNNPVPIALTVDNVHVSLLFNVGTADVEIAKVELPGNKFELQNGNNTLISWLTLQGNAGVESCKADCYSLANEAERLACIPCAATLFLKDFLARDPTAIKVAISFDNLYGETITTTIPLLIYDDNEENQLNQARSKDFIDEVVDIESLLSRALYFEIDFSATIVNILTKIHDTALGNIPGELDVTIDNIFSFSFRTEKMFVQQVDFSDLDGVPKTMPLANLPWPYDVCSNGLSDCPVQPNAVGVRDVESSQVTEITSGIKSGPISVLITGSFEALARAIHELYVQGRFCLHLSDGLVDMSLKCDDAANPTGVPCDSSGGDFGLTMAWGMKDVPLYRKNACHLRKDCIIMGSSSIFSYLGDQNLFQPSEFTTNGDGSVEVKTNEIILNDGRGFGSAFRNSKVNLFDSWVATFKFKYSCWGSCDDKGGFAFVMQNKGADAVGDPEDCSVTMKTEGIRNIPPILNNGFVEIGGITKVNCGGYKGVDDSVAVVFSNEKSQMYYFLGGLLFSDDYRMSVSGWKDGAFVLPKIGDDEVSSSVREGSDLLSYIQVPNEDDLNDEAEHSVKIVYNNVWRMLYVYLDGDDVLLEIPVDMEEMNLDDGLGFVGFTTNNAASNDNSLTVTEFTFSQGKVSPSDSNVYEEGQERSSPGKPGVFRVDSRDSCGMPRRVGGEDYDIKLINRADISVVVGCDRIEDKADGFYACWYVADTAGTYDVQYGGNVIGEIIVA